MASTRPGCGCRRTGTPSRREHAAVGIELEQTEAHSSAHVSTIAPSRAASHPAACVARAGRDKIRGVLSTRRKFSVKYAGAPTTLALLLCVASTARIIAHPAPFSYLDAHVTPDGLTGRLVVHDLDLAYELTIEPPAQLANAAFVQQNAAAIAALLRPRLTFFKDGRACPVDAHRGPAGRRPGRRRDPLAGASERDHRQADDRRAPLPVRPRPSDVRQRLRRRHADAAGGPEPQPHERRLLHRHTAGIAGRVHDVHGVRHPSHRHRARSHPLHHRPAAARRQPHAAAGDRDRVHARPQRHAGPRHACRSSIRPPASSSRPSR